MRFCYKYVDILYVNIIIALVDFSEAICNQPIEYTARLDSLSFEYNFNLSTPNISDTNACWHIGVSSHHLLILNIEDFEDNDITQEEHHENLCAKDVLSMQSDLREAKWSGAGCTNDDAYYYGPQIKACGATISFKYTRPITGSLRIRYRQVYDNHGECKDESDSRAGRITIGVVLGVTIGILVLGAIIYTVAKYKMHRDEISGQTRERVSQSTHPTYSSHVPVRSPLTPTAPGINANIPTTRSTSRSNEMPFIPIQRHTNTIAVPPPSYNEVVDNMQNESRETRIQLPSYSEATNADRYNDA